MRAFACQGLEKPVPYPGGRLIEHDVGGHDPAGERLFSPGSPFLDAVLQEASAWARSSRWYVWTPLRKRLDWPDLLRKASLAGLRPHDISQRPAYVPHLLFHFLATCVADDKHEELVPALVQPQLCRALDPGILASAVPMQTAEAELENEPLPDPAPAYGTAVRQTEELIRPRLEFLAGRQARRLARDSARVEDYFRSAKAELQRRAGREGTAPDRKARLLEKARLFDAERTRKLDDLKAKHQLTARLRLASAAVVFVPQVVAIFQFIQTSAKQIGSAAAYWDPLSRELLLPPCPVCGREMLRIAACSRCGRIVCRDDAGACCAFVDRRMSAREPIPAPASPALSPPLQ
ncbi:MAG: hypothetical protein HY922_12790 [Elusimicrobia bacterium]|nr:hypothetical protein [Elusimicrobiota bacterium]